MKIGNNFNFSFKGIAYCANKKEEENKIYKNTSSPVKTKVPLEALRAYMSLVLKRDYQL